MVGSVGSNGIMYRQCSMHRHEHIRSRCATDVELGTALLRKSAYGKMRSPKPKQAVALVPPGLGTLYEHPKQLPMHGSVEARRKRRLVQER